VLDRDDGGEAFADVVTGDLRVLVLQEIVGLGVLVDRAGEGAAEAGQVGAAVGIVNRVGVAEDLVVVGVVVLEDDLDSGPRRPFSSSWTLVSLVKRIGFGCRAFLPWLICFTNSSTPSL
jgi:hypothetical protein